VWWARRCWREISRERVDMTVKLGLTLPSFREDVATSIEVARVAEESGLDGVFAYDHLFRRNAAGERRPAIEMFALLGAVASATRRIAVGSLVARATLRPPAVLANGFDTLARVLDPERVLVAIGAGDTQSQEENETFGLAFGTAADRITALRESVDATRDRGYPVWVGGTDPAVREVAAAHADGWNRWGTGLEAFHEQAANLVAAAARSPFTVSWGGLVVLGDDDAAAAAKAERLGAGDHVIVGGPDRVADALRAYVDAGAEWLMIGPIDSSDPENARILGREILPRLR
jgi:alkanesulfonate monooxygenase SsuD/methylene tetrahydromethanopterin reductase-like flavin-dependent oxidoreductase (luciferase family)